MDSYRFGDYDDAIEMLQKLKKSGNKAKTVVFTFDFDKNEDAKKSEITPDDGMVLVRRSSTIVINEDTILPHMQLFSSKQTDIENILKEGIMHDIILFSQKT